MEVIAKINDFSCQCIEMGDYQTSLDALNCCLGCVKQLKNERTKIAEDRNQQTDGRQKRTKDTILRALKGAEQKITKRLAIAATTSTLGGAAEAAVTTTPSTKKRKALNSLPSRTTGTQGSMVSLSRKRKKRRSHMHNKDSSTLSTPGTTSTTASTGASSSQETKCSCCSDSDDMQSHINPSVPNVRKHKHKHNQCRYESQMNCHHQSEERFFVQCKPFRMTKFQWSRVDKSQYSSTFQTTSMKSDREKKRSSPFRPGGRTGCQL